MFEHFTLLVYFGTYEDVAALDPGMKIKMEVYLVNINGEPKAAAEIKEAMYVNSKNMGSIKLGSIVEKFVIPELIKRDLIE